MTESTPGPWELGQLVQNDGSVAVLGPDRVRIARVDSDEFGIGTPNARLVAAAPDIAAALEDLLERHYDERHDTDRRGADCECYAYTAAKTAIAKARGEAVPNA